MTLAVEYGCRRRCPGCRHLRGFNRDVTRAIGVLDEHLHDTEFALSEARVIHDLAQRDESQVAALRDALRLDSSYSSRLLARPAQRAMIERERSAADSRRQTVRLSAAGREAFAELDQRADVAIAGLLAALGETQRERLVHAMHEVSAVLSEPATYSLRTVVLRAAGSGDWGWIVARHGTLYAGDPRREAAWIAELDGERAGCILCVRTEGDTTAKLRLLLMEPSARGTGIGRRLVDECVRFARRAGYERLMLWTNSPLTGARRIYDAAGFRLKGEEEHQDFGPPMTGQTMELVLT